MQADVNLVYTRAEQALAAGRLDAARSALSEMQRRIGDHPAVLHLRALVEKRSGNLEAARGAFVRAIQLAPGDAQIMGNYANLLRELGEHEAALAAYQKAIAASPQFWDARYNRGLLLQKMGRLSEALDDLNAIPAASAGAKVQSARASILRQLGRIHDAADAYDNALRIEPSRFTALSGRARVAMERGEASASAFYVRALQQRQGDLDLVLGLAEALEAEGNPTGLEVLTKAVARNPDWLIGHEVLARMRSEAGEGDRFADHYLASLERRPRDRNLLYSYCRALAHGQKHGEALRALQEGRKTIPDDGQMQFMEAVFTCEAGNPRGALALLDRSGIAADDRDVRFARGRMALRAGDAEQAAELFESVTVADPGTINGWAHLDLCWRLIGEPRHGWLCGQPGLYAFRDIGISASELRHLAELLRSLHKTRAHPIGQSLRGGTQTRGRLFDRNEPELVRLHEAIVAAVHDHIGQLPPRDDTHPLLRHRDRTVAIEGSWSVRLTSRGFHAHHVHPRGILSSACYISLPAALGNDQTREGWLELGCPPAELGLPLGPLVSIEPRPGRLALFPSYLFHGTRPFAEGERLTVAFDVVAR